jgi:hypothetical protein
MNEMIYDIVPMPRADELEPSHNQVETQPSFAPYFGVRTTS